MDNGRTLVDEDAIAQYILDSTSCPYLAVDADSRAHSTYWLAWNRATLQVNSTCANDPWPLCDFASNPASWHRVSYFRVH